MPAESWRGAINMILYSIQLITDLDASNAEITADAIVEYRTFGDGPRPFLAAITDALATDTVIMTPNGRNLLMAARTYVTPKRTFVDSLPWSPRN